MRTLILITVVFFLFKCADEKPKRKIIRYSAIGSTGKIHHDSSGFKNMQTDNADELIAQDFFEYNKNNHIIKVYTSDNHAPIDGGNLYYTLDGLGIIYIRSTTWPGFSRLTTNNDSINDLINQAFAFIIEKPELHCYQCRLVDTATKTFIPPIIKDE